MPNVTSPSAVVIVVGLNVTIPCKVDASPATNIKWMKSGRVLKVCFSKRSCQLEIERVVPDHAGNYTCYATNSQGSHHSTSKLSVFSKFVFQCIVLIYIFGHMYV